MAEEFDPTTPPPFSVAKLAEHWECSPSMIRKLIDQGALGHFRVGTLIRIPRFAVQEFERLNTIGSTAAVQVAAAQPVSAEESAPSVVSTASAQPRNIARASRRQAPFKRPSHD